MFLFNPTKSRNFAKKYLTNAKKGFILILVNSKGAVDVKICPQCLFFIVNNL